MADPRRSARSTKGVNPRLSSDILPPTPVPSKRRKQTPKPSEDPPEEKENDDIIRCVCGAKEEEEDDDRMMIQCEGCEAWQHTQCMGIPKRKIPKEYFCEVCKPENHEVLLAAMERGEKPWIKGGARKRGKGRGKKEGTVEEEEEKEEEKKDLNPKTPKRGKATPKESPKKPEKVEKKSKPKEDPKEEQVDEDVEMKDDDREATVPADEEMPPPPPENAEPKETSEPKEMHETSSNPESNNQQLEEMPEPKEKPEPKAKSITPAATRSSSPTPKSKGKKESRRDLGPKTPKRKFSNTESDEEYKAESPKEPDKKSRRTSVATTPVEPSAPKYNERRRSSATATPKVTKKQQKEDTSLQSEEVEHIDELRNTSRQRTVTYFVQNMVDHAKKLSLDGGLKLPTDTTAEQFCERRALQVEYHLYLALCPDGEICAEYRQRARSIGYNLKSNPALSEETLCGRLAADRLAHMTAEEMASKELKELTQKVRLESEKQHTLLNETGPRIRRTHKGEELVDEAAEMRNNQQDTLLESGNVIRRSETAGEEPMSTDHSTHHSPRSPGAMDIDHEEPSRSHTRSPSRKSPTPKESKAPSFNISSVWSHVESPTTTTATHPPVTPRPQLPPQQQQQDKDIDHLLRDSDAGTPPYSPRSDMSPPPSLNAWHGHVTMSGIASLSASATLLGGPDIISSNPWHTLVDSVLTIDGRIKHDRATEYLCGQRFSRSSSLVMASLRPDSAPAALEFERLFAYFKNKERYAVVGKPNNPAIKDLYIVPIDQGERLPDWWHVVQPQAPSHHDGRMLVLVFVVIKSLVPGPGMQMNATSTPMQHMQHMPQTPMQPLASPFPAQNHMPQQQHGNHNQQQHNQVGRYEARHPMTRELIHMVPGLGEMQVRAIDTLLQENPELQTKPEVLAKEVEKVLGQQGRI